MKWHQHAIITQVLREAEGEAKAYHIDVQRIRGLSVAELVEGSNQNLWVIDILEILQEMISLGDVETRKHEGNTYYRLTKEGRMSAMDMKFTQLEKGPYVKPTWPELWHVELRTKSEREESFVA